jgi:hypothetical protein
MDPTPEGFVIQPPALYQNLPQLTRNQQRPSPPRPRGAYGSNHPNGSACGSARRSPRLAACACACGSAFRPPRTVRASAQIPFANRRPWPPSAHACSQREAPKIVLGSQGMYLLFGVQGLGIQGMYLLFGV